MNTPQQIPPQPKQQPPSFPTGKPERKDPPEKDRRGPLHIHALAVTTLALTLAFCTGDAFAKSEQRCVKNKLYEKKGHRWSTVKDDKGVAVSCKLLPKKVAKTGQAWWDDLVMRAPDSRHYVVMKAHYDVPAN